MKATRDYMRATRGIRRPEMIVAVSAHSAYFKAAEYFNIRLIKVCPAAVANFCHFWGLTVFFWWGRGIEPPTMVR
jgi:hypothetical protein